jgi:hypothetical protein
MSTVSDCLNVLRSTGLPVVEIVLQEREYNKLQMELLRTQRVFDEASISPDRELEYLGMKITKVKTNTSEGERD